MTVELGVLMDAVETHLATSGWFDRIARHEPKSAPGAGLSAAMWFQRVSPAPFGSGLHATSGRVELVVRLYANMLADPQDAIDVGVYRATDALIAAFSADFTLGGAVRNVDLLGAHGEPMQALAGYLNQAGTLYRVFDVMVPLIVSDMWPQVP